MEWTCGSVWAEDGRGNAFSVIEEARSLLLQDTEVQHYTQCTFVAGETCSEFDLQQLRSALIDTL